MWQLLLGAIAFLAFECPDQPDHVGGYLATAVKEFPGGIRIVQTFGAFPPKVIKWGGAFFEGDVGAAQDRIDAINQMRVQGQAVQLQIGPWQYNVIIQSFEIHPRNQWWQPYTIELIPISDLTASSTQPLPVPSPIQNLNNSSGLATSITQQISQAQQAENPADGIPLAPDANLASTTTMPPLAPSLPLTGGVTADTSVSNLTAPLVTNSVPTEPVAASYSNLTSANTTPELNAAMVPVNSFLTTLNNAVQTALGSLPALQSNADLQTSLANAIESITPLQNSPLGTDAANAIQIGAQLANIASVISPPAAPVQTTITTATNLMQLALQYYGDASQWTVIAAANDLSTPFLTGFQQIVIPSLAANA